MCSAIPLLLRFACSRGASPMNRRPVAVPGGSFALLAACRPLPLLFARFICRWQHSQTSPTGYENQIRSPNRLDERSQSRCASSSSPTTHRRTASKHLCLSSDLPPSQQSVSLTFPKSRGNLRENQNRKTQTKIQSQPSFFSASAHKDGTLFDQSVFHFDAIQFFQHGFGGDEDEDHRCGGMDQIHR